MSHYDVIVDDFEYPLGYIQMLGKSDPKQLAGDVPSFASGFTLEYIASHALDFWMTSEDLPLAENRVMLGKDGQICLLYTPNNLEGHKRLTKKLKWILEHANCEPHLILNHLYLGKHIPLAGVAHQCGTVRFGTDRNTSA